MTLLAGALRAALLYRRTPVFPSELDARIAQLLARMGHPLRPTAAAAAEDGTRRFATHSFDVVLALRTEPADPALLKAALGARFAAVRPNDYALRVKGHHAHLAIALEPRGGKLELGDAVMVMHGVTSAAIQAMRPDVLHWSLTDTMFLPEEIPAFDLKVFPAGLVLRPEIRMGGSDPAGRRRYGFVAGGSADWFGKPVLVEPTVHPLAETLAFVDLCLITRMQGHDLLARDGVIQITESLGVTIRHIEPSRVFPDGHIALSFQSRGRHIRVSPPIAVAAKVRPPTGPAPMHAGPARPGRPTARG